MEKHVTSLELSKKLKELGVKQESKFYWYENELYWRDHTVYFKVGKGEYDGGWCPDNEWDFCSAFLASELMELIPAYLDKILSMDLVDCSWFALGKTQILDPEDCKYNAHYGDGGISYIEFHSNNPADACAKMLIYLIENKLVNPNQ